MSAVTLATLSLFASGCGSDSPPTGLASQPGKGHIDPGDRCATPNAGCECAEAEAVVECGKVQREVAGQTWCSVGHRTCGADGLWGECEVEGVRLISDLDVGQEEQGLGTPTACATNKCDPFCQQVSDTGTDTPLPKDLQATPEGGITLLPSSTVENCTGIEVTPTPQVLTVTGLTGAVSQFGLQGEYFDNAFPADQLPDAIPADLSPKATVVDPQVAFNWAKAPRSGLAENQYMVRWKGWLKPSVTRDYQLCTRSDDGVRLWVGSSPKPLVDDWSRHDPKTTCSGAMTLQANTFYQVRMEMYDVSGTGVAELRWKYTGTDPDGNLIPNANLHPPGVVDEASGLVVSPRSAQFSVRGVPAGCIDGTLRAAWSLDRMDRAVIDDDGKVSLFAAIAGDITATAYVGPFQAKGTVKVKVDVSDTSQAPTGAATKLSATPQGTDVMVVRYPYADTVFPLGLRAPTIQWDNGGKAATAVMISLTSPATGTPVFSWKKILPDSNPGRYVLPQTIWSALEATAKGKTAAYSVQRVTDGAAKPAVVRPISFASAPVRGKIYYTQYRRPDIASIMVADPGSTEVAKNAFSNASGGCPVCHSVSANGTMFATSDRRNGDNGGLSRIEANGTFTLLSDYTKTVSPYRDGANDWRGFAWAPLTPDGKYALAATNIWGNSKEQVVGINTTTRTVSVGDAFLSGGNGTGLLAKYYMNAVESGWEWRRTDPTINFNWGTGSPGVSVNETFSVAWSGQVQAYTTEDYTFEVTTSGGVRLQINNTVVMDYLANTVSGQTYTATVRLQRGEKTPIALSFRDTGTNAAVALRWSSPTVKRQIVPQSQLYPNDGWHGLLATYYDKSDLTVPFITDRLESQIAANWGSGGPSPMPSGDYSDWSAVFTGQLQAPASGKLRLCASAAEDDVVVTLGGVERINEPNLTSACSAEFDVVRDTKYPIQITFKQKADDARLELRWSMAGVFLEDTVPSMHLSPPAAWSPPSRGLTVTYYDEEDFNASLGANSNVKATTRIEPNVDFDWASQRPDFSAMTAADHWSSRFTGMLDAPCDGVYEFQSYADDVGHLWLDDQRVFRIATYGTGGGAIWLAAGRHDLKLDHSQDGGPSGLVLRWKAACLNHTAFVPIPNANLIPSGDRGTGGYTIAGGDNGNDTGYFIWQTPTKAGDPSIDVTADTPGRWGLGNSAMMVPSFAPDGSKLVFIDGDSAGGNGWRKGLSTFDFDQTQKVFKNRKTILSTWPQGDVMKWPVFESDSRSVIFQRTVPADMCCRGNWTKYGFMAPTNYYEDPGRLYSVDTQSANPTPVELAKLNQGERDLDRNKAYQVTMLPQPAGGYRWAVFTSTRPYGNTLNLQGQQNFSNPASYTPILDYAKLQSMLWVAAVDDTPSAGADRSHPAFFLPNQNYVETPATGYVNERAFWVAEACREAGTAPENACEVDEDCCGGATGKAVCRIDSPFSIPPRRHCFRVPDKCVAQGGMCASNEECCTGSVCDEGTCVKPPGYGKFKPANYQRVYESNCGAGQKTDWTFFELKASAPTVGGMVEIYAESSDSPTGFTKVPAHPSAVSLPGVALIGTLKAPGSLADWVLFPMDQALKDAGVVERKYLNITLRLVPNSTGNAAPVLMELRQSFSCPPGE